MSKKGIEVWPANDKQGRWMLCIRKKRGTLTLEEIRQAAIEWEQDFYALIIKAIDEDMEQYYDDIETGDYVELYSAIDFLRKEG